MSEKLLEIKDERLSFFTPAGEVKALNGVSFSMEEGEVLVTLRDRAQRTIGQSRVTRQEGERLFLTFDGVAEGSLSVEEWPHG